MIVYKCLDEETANALEECSETVKMLFFNFTRLANSGEGYPIVYDVIQPGIIRLRLRWIPKNKSTHLPFPSKRLQKLVAAVNSAPIVDQTQWPLTIRNEVINGRFFTYVEIAVNEKGNATFLRLNPLFSRAQRMSLRSVQLLPQVVSNDTDSEGSQTSREDCHPEQEIESLSLSDDEIDLAERQAQESRTEPYRVVEDQTSRR